MRSLSLATLVLTACGIAYLLALIRTTAAKRNGDLALSQAFGGVALRLLPWSVALGLGAGWRLGSYPAGALTFLVAFLVGHTLVLWFAGR